MRTMSLMLSVWCVAAVVAAEPPAPNPDKPVDYVAWLNAGFAAKVKDNAAELYRKAATAMGEDDEDWREELAKLPELKNWGEAERATLRKRVEQSAGALDALCAAARKPDCYFELKSDSPALADVRLLEARGIRSVVIVLSYRARLRLVEGKTDGAVDDIVCLLRVGHHLQEQPMLPYDLVGVAVDTVAAEVLANLPAVAGKNLDFGRVLARLREPEVAPLACARQMIVERICALDLAQRNLRDTDRDGRYDSYDLPEARMGPGATKQLDPPQTWGELMRDVETHYRKLQQAAEAEDYAKARVILDALEKELAERKASMVAQTIGSLGRAILIQFRGLAAYRGTYLTLGLHAYRAANGRWPAELKDALAGAPAETLVDPFSGKPFVYKVQGEKMTLYSVSENGTDYGGTGPTLRGTGAGGETGDYVFWPRE